MSITVNVLLGIAVLMNLYAFVYHMRARRRLRDAVPMRPADVGRLIAFAAFMSREESGAPAHVRELARAALPDGLQIDVGPMPPTSGAVH